jgi:hypothetical protein
MSLSTPMIVSSSEPTIPESKTLIVESVSPPMYRTV